jgi:hypothetical protein
MRDVEIRNPKHEIRKAESRPVRGFRISCFGYRIVIFGWFFLGTWCAPACGDGGTIRMSEKRGGYLITVFSAPAPFRAGPVDISVLVQDALTGEPVPDAHVTVRVSKPGQPAMDYPATREAATNKLLHAAQFELPEPGGWQLEVQVEGVDGAAVIGGELEAAAPLPRWRELWPWIGWPALAIGLFGIHQALTRRRLARPGPLHSP